MTNTGARTVTLVATPPANFVVTIKDGALTADTAAITVNASGSDVFEDGAASLVLNSDGQATRLAYSVAEETFYIV
jgi:hypothetical protein